jgi:hypothetical protein
MDIHINLGRRQVEKQRDHGMTVARQHLGISTAHCTDQQAVLYRTAIDEQKLVVGDAAIIGRQAGDTAKPDTLTLEIQTDAVVDQFTAGQRGYAFGAGHAGLHRQCPPSIML